MEFSENYKNAIKEIPFCIQVKVLAAAKLINEQSEKE